MIGTTPMTQRPPCYIFAGGGTGGHIYPGLAIAEQIKLLYASGHGASTGGQRSLLARCIFVVSTRAVDRTVVEPLGVEYVPLPAQPLGLHPRRLAKFVVSWGGAVRAAREVIQQAKATNGLVHVVTTGGFVAAPVAQAAHVERVPVTLLNLDAVPGKANRFVAWRATQAFTTLPVTVPWGRAWKLVPPVVRAAATVRHSKAECKIACGLDPTRPVLMVTGGSLGAGSLNSFVLAFVAAHGEVLRDGGWQVLHQTGSGSAGQQEAWGDQLNAAYRGAGVPANVCEYCQTMGLWWGAADAAVSRAGSGAVAEAWASATPTIFVPYPYHKDQHQRANARVLVDAGGAVCIDDQLQAAANLATLGPELGRLLTGEAIRTTMGVRLRALGPVDGAARIAQAVVNAQG